MLKTNDDIFQNLFVVRKNDVDIFSTEDDIFFSSGAACLLTRMNMQFLRPLRLADDGFRMKRICT